MLTQREITVPLDDTVQRRRVFRFYSAAIVIFFQKTQHFSFNEHAQCYIYISIRATAYLTLYKLYDGGADRTESRQTFIVLVYFLFIFRLFFLSLSFPTIDTFLMVNQLVLHSDSTLGTFGRKSIVPSARVPRA